MKHKLKVKNGLFFPKCNVCQEYISNRANVKCYCLICNEPVCNKHGFMISRFLFNKKIDLKQTFMTHEVIGRLCKKHINNEFD